MVQRSLSLADRFWSKVDKSGGPDACWQWLAAYDTNGYGAFGFNHKKMNAHRVAFYLSNGWFAKNDTMHSCDNPACCNPKHLSDGTRKENMQDASRKGRLPYRVTSAKLSQIQITEIRALKESGISQRKLATKYGVEHKTIGRIWQGKTWKHLS